MKNLFRLHGQLLCMLLLILFSGNVQALVIDLTSIDRWVVANAFDGNYSGHQEFYSPSGGSFNNSADAYASCIGTLFCSSYASAHASQNTNLSFQPDSLQLSGNINTSMQTYAGSLGLADVSAQVDSLAALTFHIDDFASFDFTTSSSNFSNSLLTFQNIDTLEWILYGNTYPLSGTIGSGNYKFRYSVFGSHSNADFSFTMNAATPVSAVPEPETYAMMLVGLSFMGFTARRRKLNI